MKFRFKILLFSMNHITGNLVFLKLKAYGHDVLQAEGSQEVLEALNSASIELLVVDGTDTSIDFLRGKINELDLPVLFIGKNPLLSLNTERVSISLAFSEEEFLHKVSYLTEYNSQKNKLSLKDLVVQHYSGDLELAQKVVLSFLESWRQSLVEIEKAFIADEDKLLASKVHSFKGVLSALGETEAAVLVKKIEILIKGKRRESAQEVFSQLHLTCQNLVKELEASSLIN